MPDEEVLDPPKKKIKFDKDGLPIPQNIRQSVQLDEEGLPIPLQKKNGTSNGLTNGEDVATTSAPSTSPLPVNDPFSFDRFIPQQLDNAQEIPIVTPPITEQDKKLAAKYPIVKNYNGTVVRFKTEDEAEFYEKNNKVTSSETATAKVTKAPSPFNFDRFINQQSVIPLPNSLEDAHKEDSNRSGYIWNEFVAGVGSLVSGSGDIIMSGVINALPKSVVGASDNEALKQWREKVSPEIEKTISSIAPSNVTPEQLEKYSNEFLTSSVAGLARSTPAILSPKGAKGMALLAQAYDSGIKSINSTEEGSKLSENTKTGFGLSVGIAQAALEKYGLDKIFGKMSNKAASNLAVKTVTDLIKKSDAPITAEVLEQALSVAAKTLKQRVIDAGGKIGKAGVIEFATGTAQEFSTVTFEELTNAATGKEIFDKTSLGDKALRILYSGAQEAVGGGILGTASIPFSTTRNYIAEKVSTAQTAEDLVALKTELNDVAEKQNLSEPEKQQLNETVDNYIRVNQKIPPDTESKKEIAEKIFEREDIENEITKKLEEVVSVDEAFKPAIREESEALKGRVEEINEEIKNLASPADTKLSEPIEGLDEQGIPIGENVPKPTDTSEEISQPIELSTEDTTEKKVEDIVPIRSIEDIDNIIKAPVPRGKLKRETVQVKSIDPETNKVTLEPMEAKKAIINLKKQVGIIDMIKKCL